MTNTSIYLTSIVLAGSFHERTLDSRFLLWAENVLKLKALISAERVDLREKSSPSVARDIAIKAAQEAGIRVFPKYLERLVNLMTALGAAAGGFVLSPWQSALLGIGAYILVDELRLGEGLLRRVTLTKKRLEDLASFQPGRVQLAQSLSDVFHNRP